MDNDEQISKWKKWQDDLEGQKVKVKKKGLIKVLNSRVVSEHQEDNDYVVIGKNYLDRIVIIRCKTKEECLNSLATFNGMTIK